MTRTPSATAAAEQQDETGEDAEQQRAVELGPAPAERVGHAPARTSRGRIRAKAAPT